MRALSHVLFFSTLVRCGEYRSQTGIQRKLNFVSVRTIKERSSFLFTASCSFFSSLYPVRAASREAAGAPAAGAPAATSVDAFVVTSNIIAIDLCSALFVICGFVAGYTHANMAGADWCEFSKIVSLYVLVDLWLSTCATLVLGSIFHLAKHSFRFQVACDAFCCSCRNGDASFAVLAER